MSLAGHIPADLLEDALAQAGVGCWQWHTVQRRLRISGRFHELLGCTPETLPESPEAWLELAHPDDRPALARLFEQLGKDDDSALPGFTLRLRHASGLWHSFAVRAGKTSADAPIIVTFNEITRQKQAEAALRDSQLRFRALYNTAPLAILQWDRQGYISEWNQRAEAMFGWTAEQVVGKKVHRLLLPADQHEDFGASVKAVIDGSGDGSYRGRSIGKDGLNRECNWYNIALRSQTGQLTGILSLVLDVTDERLAHQQLEKSEKIYRTLVETSPDAILLLDMKGQLQMANRQALRLFGIDELQDLASTSVRRLIPGGATIDFLEKPEDFVGFIASRRLTLQRLDGRPFEASIAFSTVMNSRGHSTGIVLFARDITAQLRADQELEAHRKNLEHLVQERTRELENTRDSLSKIIDGSPVPTFVLDSEHVVTHWNKACEKIIGLPASQMIGTRDAWRGFYPSQRPVMADLVIIGAVANMSTLYADRFRPSQLIEGGYEAEDYFPKFDRWLFFTAAPLRDKEGRVVGAIETLQDISERKRAEMALVEAKREAELAAETKASFLANMSHEIRTPMNAVIGLAHLLLKDELSGKQRDYISRIHGAGQMLLGLINDILDFSKIEAGRMDLEQAEFSLDDVLDNVANVLLHRAQEKGLELQYVVEPEVPARLVGDSLRLSQILINLIGNALKFTARGSVTVFVRANPAPENQAALEFDVQDTGIGMTAEQQASLFRAFSQADASITRKFGGTGLGLTISKRLVEMMQGQIWASSQPGIGSTFSFTVILGRGRFDAATPRPPRHHALVVDDNPLARAILIRLLEKEGYAAQPAESGEQALALLAEARTPVDMVTIDLNMPGMDGLELADTIHQQVSPCPQLVMVTASDTSGLDSHSRLSRFDAVLNKPVTAAQIGRLVAQHPGGTADSHGNLAPLAGLQVLLVEDIPTNQLIASEMLSAFGSTVDVANNGIEALQKLIDQGLRYDIVLMDVQMPEMDGLEATRRLRASGRVDALPIVAMTAHALESERQRCLAAGMNDFLTKPIEPSQLQATLQRWRPAPASQPPAPPSESKIMTTSDELPDLPGIDKADGLRRMMNKPRLYEKVLRDFHTRFKDEPVQIRALLEAGEHATAERRAHSAKGLAGSIGACDLSNAAKDLETALREETALVGDRLDRFERELRAVLDGIATGFNIGAE